MSNTVKHKFLSKAKSIDIADEDIPLCVKFHWKRHNNEVGYFKSLRIKLHQKQLDKDFERQMNDNLVFKCHSQK